MEPVFIEGTTKTPAVLYDANQGLIEIKGRSNPENSNMFYKPLIDWVDDYAKNPPEMTIINIQLEHFNTSSSKCILDLFKKLEIIQLTNHEIMVNWYYEMDDEDILEAGENYKSMTKLPFKMIGY